MKLLDSTLKYLLMQLLESTLRLQGKLEHHWSNIGFYSSKQSLFFKRLKGWSFQKSPKSLPGLGRNSSWKNWIDVMFFQKCHKSFQTWALLKNLLLLFWMEYDPNHSSFYQAHLVHGNCLFFTGNHGKFFKIPFWIENHTLQPSFNP